MLVVEVTRLVRTVGELDDEHVSHIVEAAEGNPLLAVETARAAATGREPVDGLRTVDRFEAAHLPASDFPAAAEGAAETDLLVARGGGLGYRHALLRDAVYAELA